MTSDQSSVISHQSPRTQLPPWGRAGSQVISFSATMVATGILLLCSAVAFADEEKKPDASIIGDVLFYCSFDGTITPEIQQGEKGYKSQRDPNGRGTSQGATPAEFVKGIKGKALVTGHTKNAVYPVKGNSNPASALRVGGFALNVAEGTIEFWVMPMDWKVGDNLFHHFLTIPEQLPEGRKDARVFSLLLYKFWEWDEILAYGMAGELTGDFILRIPMTDAWVPKKWHQIVFTWDSRGASLYVDGKGAHRKYLQAAPQILTAQSFTVGGPYFVENKSLTAIDELYIFNRKLSDQEIDQRYKTELIESVMSR